MADPNVESARQVNFTQPERTSDSALVQIRNAEHLWAAKAIVRAVICVVNLVAIGAVAWSLPRNNFFNNVFDYNGGFPGVDIGSLIVLCVSFVWCALVIAIPFMLRPRRGIHPGVLVGIDLLLWLAFIVVALFTLTNVFNYASYGSGGEISDPYADNGYGSYGYGYGYGGGSSSSDSTGNYYLLDNNTWVWELQDSGSSSGQYVYVTPDNVTRACLPVFPTCADQDAYINNVWDTRLKREGLYALVDAIEWLDVALHFALFVWACVDTARRNRMKAGKKEQLVAERIIADLEKRGLIGVRDGQVVHAPSTEFRREPPLKPQFESTPLMSNGIPTIPEESSAAGPSRLVGQAQ